MEPLGEKVSGYLGEETRTAGRGGRQGTAVSLRRRSNEPELLIYREAGAGIRSAVWAPQGVRIHGTAVDGTEVVPVERCNIGVASPDVASWRWKLIKGWLKQMQPGDPASGKGLQK